MYEKVPTSLDFVAREKAIEKFWKEHDIFEKSIDSRNGYMSQHYKNKKENIHT